MPRPRATVGQTRPGTNAPVTGYEPDLWAKNMFITAYNATRTVEGVALIQNIGLGSVKGPYVVTASLSLYFETDAGATVKQAEQDFVVPASVTLAGKPVFEAALASGASLASVSAFETQWSAPPVTIDLVYSDDDPTAYYEAEILVDAYNALPQELNKTNNRWKETNIRFFRDGAPAASRRRRVTQRLL